MTLMRLLMVITVTIIRTMLINMHMMMMMMMDYLAHKYSHIRLCLKNYSNQHKHGHFYYVFKPTQIG